jgi:tripartite-type tricarboxylate transporter receptor subunit TctC
MLAQRICAACAAALLIAMPVYAADIYPTKPIRMVVGLPAGSSLDACARAVSGKGIAVSTAKRSALVPELPTMAEAGLKDFEVSGWYAVFAPAGTPRPIVQRLNAEIVRVLEIPDLKQFLFNQGLELSPSTPEQLGAQLRSDIARWGKVIRETGIKTN